LASSIVVNRLPDGGHDSSALSFRGGEPWSDYLELGHRSNGTLAFATNALRFMARPETT
jgi:hypothetical protein